jgi:hypothetical protein
MDWAEDDEDEDGGRAEVAELIEELNEASRAAVEEPWQESVPEAARDDDDKNVFERMQRHPLQRQATKLLMEFFDIAKRGDERSPNCDLLIRNALEITGGLAQTLPLAPTYEMDNGDAGLSLVQLKRALRGAAFVRGALFLLHSEKTVTEDEFHRFMTEADAISTHITDLLRTIREAQA